VNYYEHHIGDFAEATAHLTFIEDAAYSRLIRKYYATERPIPAEISAATRLVGARTREEKRAVEAVLKEFFSLDHDGWHNARCDAELEKYLAGAPERAARRAHEEARLKKHREERNSLFEQLRAVGHAPSWNTPIAQVRALHERYCNVSGTGPETGPATPPETAPATPATATHTPVPIPHSPSPIPQSPDTNHQPRTRVYERAQADEGGAGTGAPRETAAANQGPTVGNREPSQAADWQAWEQVKAAYPDFTGRRDWLTAQHHAQRLVDQGETTWAELLAAVLRYAAFVAAGGVSGPQFVLTPAKFFSAADRPWSQPWDPPVKSARSNSTADRITWKPEA
jgi:uncharacterized protein YdaU (DUF1376 family)